MVKLSNAEIRKLDDAARAGWLYYVARKTQDEIAKKLNISRQSVQRMVALSVSEGLIKVRLDHPIAKCMDLSVKLASRFGLQCCEVVPSDEEEPSSTLGLAQAVANIIEQHLKSSESKVLAMGIGRVLRSCIDELSSLDCEQHQIVSLLGNMAEHINAKHYPMPLPVLPRSKQEKDLLHTQYYVAKNMKLADQADATFVGVGNLGSNSPLHLDGFVTQKELLELQKKVR